MEKEIRRTRRSAWQKDMLKIVRGSKAKEINIEGLNNAIVTQSDYMALWISKDMIVDPSLRGRYKGKPVVMLTFDEITENSITSYTYVIPKEKWDAIIKNKPKERMRALKEYVKTLDPSKNVKQFELSEVRIANKASFSCVGFVNHALKEEGAVRAVSGMSGRTLVDAYKKGYVTIYRKGEDIKLREGDVVLFLVDKKRLALQRKRMGDEPLILQEFGKKHYYVVGHTAMAYDTNRIVHARVWKTNNSITVSDINKYVKRNNFHSVAVIQREYFMPAKEVAFREEIPKKTK